MSNLVNEIDGMVEAMKAQAGDKEVWAFIATYDETGNLDWKALATDDERGDYTLGSPMVTFASVKD